MSSSFTFIRNYKFILAGTLAALAWIILHTCILRIWFELPLALSLLDGVVSALIMLLAASLLGMIALRYLPKAKKIQETILIVLVDATVLSLICVWVTGRVLKQIPDPAPEYLQFLSYSGPIRATIYFLVIAASGIALIFYSQIREQQEAASRTAASAALVREAELQKLQLQLQPHFLFNCLNSINAMVLTRPQEAQQMVQQLSDFLRTTLKRADEQWISFSEELNYLQLYLSIEKIRFGHRLEVNTKVDEPGKGWKMPTLLLQPLVENAIKFGLYGTTESVAIALDACVKDGLLEITVTNPFDKDMQPPQGSGFGLSGLKRRLYLLFARNDLVETQMTNDIFTVQLKIPPHA